MFILSAVYHLTRVSLPFFILRTFGGNVDWLSVTTATFFIYAAITIIPTPGGAGAGRAGSCIRTCRPLYTHGPAGSSRNRGPAEPVRDFPAVLW